MYYFDNRYLAQYIDQNVELKVYVDNNWYDLVELSDVSNPKKGVGFNEFGESKYFDYRAVKQIQVNGNIITLDQLQKQMTGKDTEKPPTKPATAGEEPSMEEPEEEPAKPEKPKKGPDLSWYSPIYDLGRQLLRENENRNKNT